MIFLRKSKAVILFDVLNHKIIKEFKFDREIQNIEVLNQKSFLIVKDIYIYQYEINNIIPILKGKIITNCPLDKNITKYTNNRFIKVSYNYNILDCSNYLEVIG